jgi:hypothetical protein
MHESDQSAKVLALHYVITEIITGATSCDLITTEVHRAINMRR